LIGAWQRSAEVRFRFLVTPRRPICWRTSNGLAPQTAPPKRSGSRSPRSASRLSCPAAIFAN